MRFSVIELEAARRQLANYKGQQFTLPSFRNSGLIIDGYYNELKVVYLGGRLYKVYHPSGNELFRVPTFVMSGKKMRDHDDDDDDIIMLRPTEMYWMFEHRSDFSTSIYRISHVKPNFLVMEIDDLDLVPYPVLTYIANNLSNKRQ